MKPSFSRLALICAPLLLSLTLGCDSPDSATDNGDSAVALDLGALSGCNRLNACLDNCTTATSCAACGQAATPLAIALYNAFDACRLTLCHGQTAGDGGMACTAADLDPSSSSPLSPACVTCAHAAATLQSPTCKPKTDACLADKP